MLALVGTGVADGELGCEAQAANISIKIETRSWR